MFESNRVLLEKNLEMQATKLEVRQRREENKFLYKEINSIGDQLLRAYFQNEQRKIFKKRAEKENTKYELVYPMILVSITIWKEGRMTDLGVF